MNITYIIFAIFVLALLIRLIYLLFFFGRLAFYKNILSSTPVEKEPISVIVSAKNEAENLIERLPLILEQDYPVFEVVVINDCSLDDTEDILMAFKKQYNYLKIVTVKETQQFWGSKKFALTLGIKASKYENLLFTDADCCPISNQWLNAISEQFIYQKEIVLGYGAYEKKTGILNKIIRYDTFNIALQYFSFALAGIPYMGVGRNLAYKKSLFFKHKGFAAHQHIKSGDDDLFVNIAATKTNTQIVINKESYTLSVPKTTFKKWWKQKRRHLTTGKYYKIKHKLLLSLPIISQYLAFSLMAVLLFIQFQVYIVLSMFFFVFIIKMIIISKSMLKLNEKDLLLFSPFYEIILLVLYPFLLMSNVTNKQNKWKN